MHASMRVYSPVSRLRARWPRGTRSRMPPRPAPALIACLLGSALAAQAALFSASATIEEGDTTYDGQDIIVSNCTLTVNGPHAFASLSLIHNATLAHTACTDEQVYAIDLTISGALTLDASSKIDVTGRGFRAGRTAGNSSVGGATWPSGGSYGGLGAGSSANKTYGDFRNPVEPGSGSSNVSGGGLIRITAGSAVVDGVIRANGANGGYDYPCGGSGGGIRLDVVALSGSGRVEADGGRMSGASNSGHAIGGGGGRVALYYGESTFDLTNGVRALAGEGIPQALAMALRVMVHAGRSICVKRTAQKACFESTTTTRTSACGRRWGCRATARRIFRVTTYSFQVPTWWSCLSTRCPCLRTG